MQFNIKLRGCRKETGELKKVEYNISLGFLIEMVGVGGETSVGELF